ncbi:hypothetical protein MT418_003819 [Batrachochytrium dendrobatidis]
MSRLNILKQWFGENKIAYDEEKIRIEHDTNNGFRVFAKQTLEVGDILCAIPKEAILSIKNCGVADVLEEQGLGGQLGLVIALMFERSLGEKSPWYGYIQSLPLRENIPLFWEKDQQACLDGTAVAHLLEPMPKDLKADYKEHVVPLVKENSKVFNAAKMTFDDFTAATSLVTSRAFRVDVYHEEAMVPLADLFNHRTDGEHVHFETNAQVCYYCGASGVCECDMVSSSEGSSDEDWEDLAADNELEIDHDSESDSENEIVSDRKEWTEKGSKESDTESVCSCPSDLYCTDSEDESEDELIDDGILAADMIEMSVVLSAKRGEEIFNTYGTHSNADLLSRYGFAESNNPYSTAVILSSDVVKQAAKLYSSKSAIEARLVFLNEKFPDLMHDLLGTISRNQKLDTPAHDHQPDQTELGCCDEDNHDHHSEMDDEEVEVDLDYMHIGYDGHPSLVTLCTVAVLVADNALFSFWNQDLSSALEYFMRIHNDVWKDTIVVPVSKKNSRKHSRASSKSNSFVVTQKAKTPTTNVSDGCSPTKIAVFQFISQLCAYQLKRYPTNLQTDRQQLQLLEQSNISTQDSMHTKFALIVRIQEKTILKHAIGICDGIEL